MHFYNIQNVTKRGPLFWHLFLIQNAQIAILFDMSDHLAQPFHIVTFCSLFIARFLSFFSHRRWKML